MTDKRHLGEMSLKWIVSLRLLLDLVLTLDKTCSQRVTAVAAHHRSNGSHKRKGFVARYIYAGICE